LSRFEVSILGCCTETYAEMWEADKPDLSEAECLRWLIDDLLRRLWSEADKRGWELLKEGEETDAEDPG
jgi:hypothetical protein